MTALEYARMMISHRAKSDTRVVQHDYAYLLQATALVAIAEAFTRMADEMERRSS